MHHIVLKATLFKTSLLVCNILLCRCSHCWLNMSVVLHLTALTLLSPHVSATTLIFLILRKHWYPRRPQCYNHYQNFFASFRIIGKCSWGLACPKIKLFSWRLRNCRDVRRVSFILIFHSGSWEKFGEILWLTRLGPQRCLLSCLMSA